MTIWQHVEILAKQPAVQKMPYSAVTDLGLHKLLKYSCNCMNIKCLVHWVKFSADDNEIFFLFSQKTGFDISCKLSPKETICMKCQNPVFWKNKKNIFVICRNSPEVVNSLHVAISVCLNTPNIWLLQLLAIFILKSEQVYLTTWCVLGHLIYLPYLS